MDADRLLRLLERADLADDPQLQELVRIVSQSGDTRTAEYAERIITHRAADHIQYPFDDHDPVTTRTKLDLGTTFTGSQFTLDESRLMRHVLVAGQSGTGKTTLLYTLLQQVSVPWWAFDLKTDYRHLLTDPDTADVVVLPWTQLRVNPLQPPPGVAPRRWAQTIQELFGDAYDLLSGSQHYLLTHLLQVYEAYEFDVAAPCPPGATYPALADLRAFLESAGATGRVRTQYKERLIDRLAAVTAATDPVYDCSRGYDLADLLGQNVVFELDGLASDHQDFLMELVLAWVYRYRDANQQRGDQLRHVFVLDEGKRLFSVFKERSDAKGLPQIDVLTDTMREFGEGLVVSDQEPKKLTDSIVANTHVKVLFPIGDASQFRAVAASMRLSDRQRDVAYDLGVGQGIVRVGANGPYPVQFHDYDLEKTVTDTDVQRRMQDVWSTLEHAPRVDQSSLPSSIGETQTGETPETAAEAGETSVEPGDTEVSDEAAVLLKDVAEHPFKQVTYRYPRVGGTKAGIAAKKELSAAGFLREKYVTQPDGRIKLLELTEAGREYLAAQAVDVTHTGRGGIVHRYWQQQVKTVLEEQGWTATREKQNADVLAEHGDTTVAVEIAMRDRQREVEHVRDRLEAGVDGVVVLCRKQVVVEGLKEKLEEAGLLTEAVRVEVVQAFDGFTDG